MNFEELLEQEIAELEEHEVLSEDDAKIFLEEIQDEYELTEEEIGSIMEELKKRVSSGGNISKVKSKKVRHRRATRTTGLSRSQLRLRARKAAKTRRKDVTGTKRASRKRKKAMRRRKSMGLS